MAQQLSTNTFGCAKWVVSADATQGTHTTIATALTSASSGDTIFIRTGTYTENLTLKAGVNLATYDCDGLNGNVTIVGKATFTAAGTVDITGIRLQTNSDYFVVVSGSAASIVNLYHCYLNCSNNTGISMTTSSSSASINCYYCTGDTGTTGVSLFSSSSAGSLAIRWSSITNSGGSTTQSTVSAGTVTIEYCDLAIVLSASSTGVFSLLYSNISATNAIALTTAGTATNHGVRTSRLSSGTASALSIGTGTAVSVYDSEIASSNTDAITGAGTLNYSSLVFSSTSSTINTTTQSGGTLQGGLFQAPSAGWLGEQIRSYASAVSLTSTTAANVTSVSLTAGVWDISGVATIFAGSGGTIGILGISASTGAIAGNLGDQYVQNSQSFTELSLSIPAWRLLLSSTTTYYLVANSTFSGSATVYGRISATRVG